MANNITVKDANSVNQVVKTTETLGVHTHHHNVDSLPPLPVGANHIGQVSLDATANVADGGGSLTVDDGGGSLTVDGTVAVSGTTTVQDNASLVDNAAFTDGTSRAVIAGFVFDEVAGTALTENDAAAARIDSKRAQINVLEDATVRGRRAGVSSSGALFVDGSLGGTTPVNLAAAIPAGTNNIGDVDVASFAAGAITEVQGDVAHDAAVGGNPVLVGAEARTTDGTAVANGDVTRVQADTLGKQVVLLGANHDRQSSGTANFTTTTAADVIAAAGAGVKIVVTAVLVTNAHATVGTKVSIRDGATVKITAFAAAAGGGFSYSAGGRPLFVGTANTAVQAVCGTTGSDIDVSISGYTIGN